MFSEDLRLLLVEDCKDDILITSKLLREAFLNIEILVARSIEDAKQVLSTNTIDAALLDINLPDSNGPDGVLGMIEVAPDVAIVVLTGSDIIDLPSTVLQAGAQDHLSKNDLSKALLQKSIEFAIERKRFEGQLRQQNALIQEKSEQAEMLALIARNTDNGVILTDRDGSTQWVNEGFSRISGYTPNEAIGLRLGEMLQGDGTSHETVRVIQDAIRASKSFSVQILNYCKNGEQIWLNVEGKPITNAAGKVSRYMALQRDITQEVEASNELAAALAESEALVQQHATLNEELQQSNLEIRADRRILDTIINSVPQALFWKDCNSVYLGCNNVFAELAGVESSDAMHGKTDFDLPWTRDEAEEYRLCDQQVMRGDRKIVNLEEAQTGPNGEERCLWTSKTPIYHDNGEVQGIVGIFADVTEIKNAQSERDQLLLESAELAHIIRNSPDELYIFDKESLYFLEANSGACLSTGYTVDELKKLTPIDLKPAYDESEFRKLITPLVAGAVSRLEFQTDHQRKDGKTYPAGISLHITEYRGQEVFVAFIHDLTEMKLLEQKLSQAQKLESLGQMSAGIAHEINTPMQYVGDNIEFLSESAEKLFSVVDKYRELLSGSNPMSWKARIDLIEQISEQCQFDHIRNHFPNAIEECREGVNRTVKIVKAMKDFSYLGGKEMKVTNLNMAVESAVAISRNRWKYAADLQLELDPALPSGLMFVAEINQVLLNLVINAADAVMERFGEGNLGRIVVRTRHTNKSIQFQIEDNGCGIPSDVLPKVFDPFFTTKDVGKGTGQGLSITHNIVVNMHAGHVDVDSKLGEGTVFTISIPIVDNSVTEEFEPAGSLMELTS